MCGAIGLAHIRAPTTGTHNASNLHTEKRGATLLLGHVAATSGRERRFGVLLDSEVWAEMRNQLVTALIDCSVVNVPVQTPHGNVRGTEASAGGDRGRLWGYLVTVVC